MIGGLIMATNNNQARINSLNRQKSSYQNQINSTQSNIDDINNKIARLENAYRNIASMKYQTWALKGKASNISNKHYKWKGNHHNRFKTDGNLLVDEYKEYIKSLDNVMDSINYEITNLKNSRDDQWGLLGYFRKQIRNISTQIRNLLN